MNTLLGAVEQYPFITGMKASLVDAVKNPNDVLGKVIVFPGNYDEISYIPEMCGRAFKYDSFENKWLVYDFELRSRKCVSKYEKHFDSAEIPKVFGDFLKKDGLLIDG